MNKTENTNSPHSQELIQTSVSIAATVQDKKPEKNSLEQPVTLARTGVDVAGQINNRQHSTGPDPHNTSSPSTSPQDTALPQPEPVSTAALESIYEETQWQILVDGKSIKRLVAFELSEGFSRHTRFTLRIHHAEVEEARAPHMYQSKDLLGKTLTAMLGSHLQEDRVAFTGLITGVTLAQGHGLNGDIILSGYSPTILLDSGAHLRSFYNQSLENITRKLLEPLSGKLDAALQPRYKPTIAYLTQYKESHWQFLCRLSAWYGEWVYYNGKKLCLGKPSDLPHQKLYYGRQLEDVQLDVQLTPLNTVYTGYFTSSNQSINQYPPERVEGLNYYGDFAVEKSQELFGSPVKNKPVQRASDLGSLMHLAEVNQATAAAGTFSLTGRCRSPYLVAGTRLTIMVDAQTELGEYLVTEVNHRLENGNRYRCTFKAIGGDVNVIPVPILPAPTAEPQLAVVRKNDDPQGQGRVRVQFQWQEDDEMTDWIRVVTPDGGGGGKVAQNRGFVFIPEVNDLVLVSFRDSNIDAPIVTGSILHGKIAKGGGKANRTKTLTTRSGSMITLDDEQGSVTVSDPSGNQVVLHGNGTITIQAPNAITFQSKDITINASNSLIMSAVPAKEGDGGNIAFHAKKAIHGISEEEGISFMAKQNIDLLSTEGDLTLQAKRNVTVTSADKVLIEGKTTQLKGEHIEVAGSEVNINES